MKALLRIVNCTDHKIDESDLPERLSLLFLPPNLTSTRHPADMGMIASLEVGYKSITLTFLLSIFGQEGGFDAASPARARKKSGCRGLAYGGKPHILDVMEILANIWNKDRKYARSDVTQQ